jgi:hypothetical protein
MHTPSPSHLAWASARDALDHPQTTVLLEPDVRRIAPRLEPIVVWYSRWPEPFVAMLHESVAGFPCAYRWPGYHTACFVGEPARWLRPPVLWDETQHGLIEFPVEFLAPDDGWDRIR